MNDNLLQFKEKTTHGTPLSPLAKYHTDISDLLPFYPIHWHEEMEILKVQSGQGTFCIEGKWYNAAQGDIIILTPFVMHSINRDGNHDMSLDAIVFNLRLLETGGADVCTLKYFAPILNSKQVAPAIIRTTDEIYHAFDQSITAILMGNEKEDGFELQVKANLYWIFYHLYSRRLVKATVNLPEDKRYYSIKQVLEYIRANYMNEITLTQLAKLCGYSEYYLMKLFKKFCGITCVDYINNYRLNIAGQLLLSTEDDVSSIAYQVGYNNISYFNKQFKDQYGMTPKQFRSQRLAQVSEQTA